MKHIIVSLFVSLSLAVSAPAKADSLLNVLDLTYSVGKLLVYSAAAGVMFVGGAAAKAMTPSEKQEKEEKIAEAPKEPVEPALTDKASEQNTETPKADL